MDWMEALPVADDLKALYELDWRSTCTVFAALMQKAPLVVSRDKADRVLEALATARTNVRRRAILRHAWRLCNHDEFAGNVLLRLEDLTGGGACL